MTLLHNEIMPKEPDEKPGGKPWPPNSLRYYRESADLTLEEVGKQIGRNHQYVQRLETRVRRLTHDQATDISKILRVPAELLGFSESPDAYSWAAKAVPVLGVIDSEMRVIFSDGLRRIGVPHVTVGYRALELGDGSIPGFTGWSILYDDAERESVSPRIIERQTKGVKFIVRLKDGSAWWRTLVPSTTRRNHYHLESEGKRPVYDANVDWVTEMRGFNPPGYELPPSGKILTTGTPRN